MVNECLNSKIDDCLPASLKACIEKKRKTQVSVDLDLDFAIVFINYNLETEIFKVFFGVDDSLIYIRNRKDPNIKSDLLDLNYEQRESHIKRLAFECIRQSILSSSDIDSIFEPKLEL